MSELSEACWRWRRGDSPREEWKLVDSVAPCIWRPCTTFDLPLSRPSASKARPPLTSKARPRWADFKDTDNPGDPWWTPALHEASDRPSAFSSQEDVEFFCTDPLFPQPGGFSHIKRFYVVTCGSPPARTRRNGGAYRRSLEGIWYCHFNWLGSHLPHSHLRKGFYLEGFDTFTDARSHWNRRRPGRLPNRCA